MNLVVVSPDARFENCPFSKSYLRIMIRELYNAHLKAKFTRTAWMPSKKALRSEGIDTQSLSENLKFVTSSHHQMAERVSLDSILGGN